MKCSTTLRVAMLAIGCGLLVSAWAATPGKPDSVDKTKSATEEKEPVLPGHVIARPNGTFLAFQVENNNFKLTFYTAKKKPMPPDLARAVVRYDSSNYRVRIPIVVLLPSGTADLSSAMFIKSPVAYRIFLSLFDGDKEEVVESYNFNVSE